MDTPKTVWHTEQYEQFNFLCTSWDVQKAKKLLSEKKTVKVGCVEVKTLDNLLGGKRTDAEGVTRITMGVSVDWDRIKNDCEAPADKQEIDLSVPLIFVQTKAGNVFPIDGWHRAAKALRLGVEKLPAIMLNKKDSLAVMLR